MKKTLLITGLIGLMAAFVIGMLLRHAKPEAPAAAETAQALVRMHSPMLGDPGAPVVIVEFLDPACETCRKFYPLVKQLMASQPGKITLVIRYAPFHRGSDQIVALLEAARRQGQFWPALEVLLESQEAWTPDHRPQLGLAVQQLQAARIALDWDRVRNDMLSPAVLAVLNQDLADAGTLQVAKTPEFFVNGKPLPAFGYEQLQKLVAAELQRTTPVTR